MTSPLTVPAEWDRIVQRLRDRIFALERGRTASVDLGSGTEASTAVDLVFAKQIAGTENTAEAPVREQVYDTRWGALIDPTVNDPSSERTGVLALDWDRFIAGGNGTYYNGWDLYSTWGDGPYLEWGTLEMYSVVGVVANESQAQSRNDVNMVAFTPIARYTASIYAGARVWEYYPDDDYEGTVSGSVAMAFHEQEVAGGATSTRLDTCGIYLRCNAADGDGLSHLGSIALGAQLWLRPKDSQSDDPVTGLIPFRVGIGGSIELYLHNNGDMRFNVDTCGIVVWDRDTNSPVRLYVDSGVLLTEAA